VGLTAGGAAPATVAATAVMGTGGGLVLATVQAVLADHHGEGRTVALAEANVAASLAYVTLIGVFALVAALHLDWRAALLVSLAVPALAWCAGRGVRVPASPVTEDGRTPLPPVFWVAVAALMCATAAEWCVTAWGATFVEEGVAVSTDSAITLMGGYFGGVVVGRVVGSRLAHRHEPGRLFAVALVIAGVGFAVLWPSAAPAQAVAGLVLLGLGIGNLFPMGLALAVGLAPDRSGPASGRAVAMTSLSVLLAPLAVGAVADATSLGAALLAVPVFLLLAGLGLVLVRRGRTVAPQRVGAGSHGAT
jgi:fucose permease